MAPSAPLGPVVRPALLDTSPAGLAAAIEADTIGTRVLGAEIPLESHLDADASWAFGGPTDVFRNVVASARFDPATADRRIAEIVAAFDAVPAPHLWWRAPFHQPSDLGARLEAATVFEVGSAPAMALDLRNLVLPRDPAHGLEIRPVTDLDGLGAYLDLLASDPPPPGVPPQITPEYRRRVLDHAGSRLAGEPVPMRYIGWLDGRPVACSRLSLAGGTAGIYSVETLPEARGRGIGSAVTAAPLLAARSLGYRIATLQSTEAGFNVYRRLGFDTIFTYAIHVHLPGGGRPELD